MRITIKIGQVEFERGNSKDERNHAARLITAATRARYTPQSKARAKAFAKG